MFELTLFICAAPSTEPTESNEVSSTEVSSTEVSPTEYTGKSAEHSATILVAILLFAFGLMTVY